MMLSHSVVNPVRKACVLLCACLANGRARNVFRVGTAACVSNPLTVARDWRIDVIRYACARPELALSDVHPLRMVDRGPRVTGDDAGRIACVSRVNWDTQRRMCRARTTGAKKCVVLTGSRRFPGVPMCVCGAKKGG